MQAAQITQFGGGEVVELVDVPAPTLAAGEVLIDIHAASLNAFDWKVISGAYKDAFPVPMPFRPGTDVAGVVVALGAGVTDFAVGDKVYGSAMVLSGGSGAFAQQATTKPSLLAKQPTSVSMTEAAALPLAGVSVVQALIEGLKLTRGQTILITGGAGGIGSFAIQLAKHLGATVATTVRNADDATFAQSLGADQVLTVSDQSVVDTLHDYDAVYDTVGGDARTDAMRVLKRGGTIVSMLGKDDALAAELGVSTIAQTTTLTTERLTKLAELVDAGAMKPQLTIFPFAKIQDAVIMAQAGNFHGKIVLTIQEN